MDFSFLVDALITALILPFQLMLIPIDNLLKNIDGIEIIPNSITAITSFVGSIPETIVSLFHFNPLLWNAVILVFIAYLVATPAVNGIKKLLAWIT